MDIGLCSCRVVCVIRTMQQSDGVSVVIGLAVGWSVCVIRAMQQSGGLSVWLGLCSSTWKCYSFLCYSCVASAFFTWNGIKYLT